MGDPIREIEKIIDNHHKTAAALQHKRGTALLYALRIFEDACRLAGTTEINMGGDDLDHFMLIRDQLDSLRTAVLWIFDECEYDPAENIDTTLKEKICYEFADLHFNHAKPYYVLCGAYISYSRKRSTATYIKNTKQVIFNENNSDSGVFITDVNETLAFDNHPGLSLEDRFEIVAQEKELQKSINFVDGHIRYVINYSIWAAFRLPVQRQWDFSSELPIEWEFDKFTLKGYRNFWITLATYCSIHMFACLHSDSVGAAAEDAVIVRSRDEYIRLLHPYSSLDMKEFESIFDFLIYENDIKNNDVILQPFIPLNGTLLALTPHLLLVSRPERNLITLIHKKKDHQYFDLTNQREQLMLNELSSAISTKTELAIITNKELPGDLPDIDYALYDMPNHTVLLCELKWLIEPDSVQEVCAREAELLHGCRQIQSVAEFANNDPMGFMRLAFGEAVSADYKFIPCVISKKGIRAWSDPIPIISLPTFISLYKEKKTIIEFFESIKKRSFLIEKPERFDTYGRETIAYAGYKFEMPALIKIRRTVDGTCRRSGTKTGRNDPCPCESGKKYKKCCGRSL